jgi:hypothetical protein
VERDKPKKIGISRTNFAAFAMEIQKMGGLNFFCRSCHGNKKKGGFKFFFFYLFHQTS